MKKILLFLCLTVGIGCAKETCSFTGIDEEKYRASFAKTYTFQCTGIKGYDYIEHEVLIKFNSLYAIFSSYYIDGIERKLEVFKYEENEKKNGDVEFIGYKGITLYDEFQVEMKENYCFTSFESMEKTILNKWNYLKKFINK